MTRTLAAAVCIHRDKQILVGWSPKKEGWEFPGGKSEGDESILDTAARECREECGIDLDPHRLKLRGFVEGVNEKAGAYLTLIFAFRLPHDSNDKLLRPSEELDKFQWVNVPDLFFLQPKTQDFYVVVGQCMGDLAQEVLR